MLSATVSLIIRNHQRNVDGCASDSDFVDEFVRQIQKPMNSSPMALQDADLHRVVKEMVLAECKGTNLHFSKTIANVLVKDLDKMIDSRAIFILLALVENKPTEAFVRPALNAHKAAILKKAQHDKSTGLQLLAKKL